MRKTPIGLAFLLKRKDNFYSKDDGESLKISVSAATYAIKDAELNDVFKIQLKLLKDAIIEKRTLMKSSNSKPKFRSGQIKNEFVANIDEL